VHNGRHVGKVWAMAVPAQPKMHKHAKMRLAIIYSSNMQWVIGASLHATSSVEVGQVY